jgi:membrane-associated phospholipid phosphatase
MHWLQILDTRLFHWVNPTLSSGWLDVVMPFVSGNRLFVPAFLLICAVLIWKGGARGRLCVIMLVAAILLGDTFLSNNFKHLIGRPRPFHAISDVHIPAGVGISDSASMPSSHATNWFAATMVVFIFYRRSFWFMLPLACLVGFSRIYNGMHYPGDILAGAILGAGSAAGLVWTLNVLWQTQGRRWFPLWWQKMPSLVVPEAGLPADQLQSASPALVDKHWLRLGYLLIFVQLVVNLIYAASGRIDLQEDETYQWLWSKHLALSYYSKPPLIAYTHWLGTHIWGDTVFGVRFFAPIITAIVSIVVLRFLARAVNPRIAFWMTVLRAAVPFMAVGSTLMTIDPLSVMFWTLAMVAGWRAVQEDSTTSDWCWVGLWMGLGFLSKYTGLFQLLSWVLFFVLWGPARKQLRRPGPYAALLINLLFAIPVLIWNYQHGWITITHVAHDGRLEQAWDASFASLWYAMKRYTFDFVWQETVLLNPFFVIPAIWAVIAFWKRKPGNPLLIYFFSMGAPIIAIYFLLSFHSRVLLNWIAPSFLPMFCLAAVYYDARWREGSRAIKPWFVAGISAGCVAIVLLHETRLINRLTGIAGYTLTARQDPLRRVSGWKETALVVEGARQKLMQEGKPVFIIGGHYGITSEIAFNLPEARTNACLHPLVYFQTSDIPLNQFYFWPGYKDRKGENAIYVQELDLIGPDPTPPPQDLKKEFESVTDLGAVYVIYRGQQIRRIQLCECRGLR